MTPTRCSDDAGFAGRLGLTASRACPLIGVGLPAGFAGLDFFRGAGRSGAFLAVFFRIAVTFLTAFLRVLLPAGIFLSRALAFTFAFLLVAIAASLTLTDFGPGSPHYPPKPLKDKEKKAARRIKPIRHSLGNF